MKRLRKILIVLGVFLITAVLAGVIRHYQLRSALEAYKAKLKADGEPMVLTELLPPAVPPDQNQASVLLKFYPRWNTNWDNNLLDTNPPPIMRAVAPGKWLVGWKESVIHGDFPHGTNQWPDLGVVLANKQDDLNQLRQFTTETPFDFQIPYTNGWDNLPLPELSVTKMAGKQLSYAAIFDLHQGNTASALQDTRAILGITQGLSHDRMLISELVRIAILSYAQAITWQSLQATNLSEAQLAVLQNDWEKIDLTHSLAPALAMARATAIITVDGWRRSDTLLSRSLITLSTYATNNNFFEKKKLGANFYLWRYWWSYSDELRMLQGGQILLAAARSVETNHGWLAVFHQQDDGLKQLAPKIKPDENYILGTPLDIPWRSMLSDDLWSMGRTLERFIKAEAAQQMTIAALALKRYELKHGEYPADLAALVPEFCAEVPWDPIDGHALRYQKNADGTFLLYSIGDDGVDDKGDPRPVEGVKSLYWLRARDWVWPQPATPDEVEAYLAKPN